MWDPVDIRDVWDHAEDETSPEYMYKRKIQLILYMLESKWFLLTLIHQNKQILY